MIFRLLTLLFTISVLSAICPEDQYCLSCLSNRCVECIFSYINEETGACVVPENAIENCSEYTDATTCVACVPNYYLSQNECIKIPIENCLMAKETTVEGENSKTVECTICKDGILVTDQVCNTNNKCQIAACIDCMRDVPTEENQEGEEICVKCEAGKSVNPLTGDCVDEVTANCLELDDEALESCGQCRPGFFNSVDDTCLATNVYSAETFSQAKTKIETGEDQSENQTTDGGETSEKTEIEKREEGNSDSEESTEDSIRIFSAFVCIIMIFQTL